MKYEMNKTNKTKRILALMLLVVMSLGIAQPVMAATYTIQQPAGATGAATVRGTASSGGENRGTIGTGSTVDITDTTITNGYVKVKVLSVKNGTFIMGKYPNNEGYVLSTWVSGFNGGGTTPPPGGGGVLKNGYTSLTSGYVNIRSDRTASSNILGSLYLRDPVLYYDELLNGINGDGNKWFKIEKPMVGYVASTYVKEGGNAGGSSTTSGRKPFCAICLREMNPVQGPNGFLAGTPTGVTGTDPYGSMRGWIGLTLRMNYTCSVHATGGGTIFDGPKVAGWCWDTDYGTLVTYHMGNPPGW